MTNQNKLSICTTCFHTISETETMCPSCGERVKSAERGQKGRLALSGFLVFNIIMAAWYWAPSRSILGMAHAQDTETAPPWFGADTDKVFFIWVCGAILFGALAYYSKAK